MSKSRAVKGRALSWRARLALLAAILAPFVSPATGHAQSPRSIAFIADSLAAKGDTVRALAFLDSALRVSKDDGAAWHQYGLLYWSMVKSKRNGSFMNDPRAIRQLMGADTALRMATKLAPDSARFWLTLGRFNLASGVSTRAVKAPVLIVEAAVCEILPAA